MIDIRTLGLIAMFMIVAASFSGCNTVDGVGRDIEKAGESIQKL